MPKRRVTTNKSLISDTGFLTEKTDKMKLLMNNFCLNPVEV